MADSEIPDVSMNNTKKEILEAYGLLLKEFKRKQEQTLGAEEKLQEIQAKKQVALAEQLSPDTVLKGIGDLKASIGALLGQVSDLLESEVSKLSAVGHAIEVKEAELQEIYDIQREAGGLAALIEAQKQKKEIFERELADRRRQLEGEIEKTRADWAKEKQLHADEVVERNVEEKRRRQREKEEFEYESEREKRRLRDQFEEEQEKLQKELRAKREDLDRREDALNAQEDELKRLREKVERVPSELDAAVSKATTEATKRLTGEAQIREELLKKEFEGERNVLLTRIESLEKIIKEQVQQINRLTQTQDKAYQQVQDIALKAVEGAGNLRSLSQAFVPSSEKKKPEREE